MEVRLCNAKQGDDTLKLLYLTIQKGWPNNRDGVNVCFHPYWNYRDEPSINSGLIYKGHDTVIPPSMRHDIKCAVSNVRMAKQVLFCPGMSNSCKQCAKYQYIAPMKSLPIVSQDLFELDRKPYLVSARHFSYWIEVDAFPDTLSVTVINGNKAHFARYGIPEICHTDNSPQFTSKDYQEFASAYQFKRTRSSPCHPQGNGRAEAAVKVAKKSC